ncbi:MAG: DUF4175 family protein, partial [Thermodesulfobacteriota bacterium]
GLALAASAASAIFAALGEGRRARPRIGPARAAELLAGASPGLRELLLTGADLAAWGEGGAEARGASPELARAHVEEAERTARELDPARAVPGRPAALRALQAVTAAALVALWGALDPGARGPFGALFAGGAPAPVTLGNLHLTYAPPAYTGLPERRVEGTDGAARGYRGTRVTLEGEVSRALEGGRWVGPGGEVVPLALEGRRFSVSWLLDRPGTYSLAFFQGGREVPSDFLPRAVALVEDTRPAVELTAPEGDREVTSDQEVEVAFAASDDFGVERAELVLQGEAEVRLPLSLVPAGVDPGAASGAVPGAVRRVEGRTRFLPLAHPQLGEGAHLRVEAWDGDTVSGPKAGSSRSVYVSFLDKRRLVAEIAGLEERLLEALLGQLADHLELPEPAAPADLERLRAKGHDLLRLFDQLVDRVERAAAEGALGAVAVLKMEGGLRGALEPFLAGGAEREPLIAELERDILFLDRLLRSLRMEEALSLGDELAALQRSLFDDLQRGAAPEDLLARVDQLQQLLAQMAQKLSQGAAEMPDAFANADAVRDMPASELEDTLRELREALEAGDREKAQALAEKLLETLTQWLAALEKAAGGASQGEMDPLLHELSELEADVQDIAARQEKILQETQEIGREASRRALEGLREEVESLLERSERRLRVVEEAARRIEMGAPRAGFHGMPAPPGTEDRPPGADRPNGALRLLESRQRVGAAVAEVREALREDLGRTREGARALGEAMEDLRAGALGSLDAQDPRARQVEENAGAARREVEGLLQDLDALAGRRLEGLRPQDAQALGELGEREGELGERTGAVGDRLEGLARRSPFVDPGLPGRARAAQQAMGEAGERLGQGDPFGAVPPETRALEELAELGRRLEGARRQTGEGQPGQGLQVMRRPGQRPGQGQDVDRSPVEIPREMEARELRAFREEVLRAMQGRYPRDYEEEVERYYERLIR